jgi:hypothetical protein
MRWFKALVGLAVVGGFVWFALQFREGKIDVPVLPRHAKPASLAKGTPVRLLLLTEVSSGGSKPGDRTRWVVAEDVMAGEGVAIAQGRIVEGTVTESREGTVLGAVTNRPARLAVKFDPVRAVDGTEIAVGSADGGTLQLTKANTRREPAHVLEAWDDPEARRYAETLFSRMAKGEKLSPDEQREADKLLGTLAERYGLESAKKAGGGAALGKVLRGDTSGLSVGELGLAVAAIEEVSGLVGGAGKAVKRMFTGSNIRAAVGLELTVETLEAATVRPRLDEAPGKAE